ncbi:MAG: ATP-binding cassette domain-containing protein, partial [Bdellovibrionota bacterium]
MKSPLELTNVSFGYRRKPLFEGVNLTVAPGEFVTIMGENGAGKSTLIDCLLGHSDPRSGSIRFWGRENRGAARAEILQ